ncbi:hypothetical protein TNCV_5112791 [Trichonephila clavipes]|nr:hypothetical protein TNCV_5112791 [Trichonephila clavipes]
MQARWRDAHVLVNSSFITASLQEQPQVVAWLSNLTCAAQKEYHHAGVGSSDDLRALGTVGSKERLLVPVTPSLYGPYLALGTCPKNPLDKLH